MAKFNFNIESENLEQDLAKLVDVFVNAYEKCNKIDNDVVAHVHNEVHSLDNRIDGLEAMIKSGNFKEVENKVYSSSKEYVEDKKKK